MLAPQHLVSAHSPSQPYARGKPPPTRFAAFKTKEQAHQRKTPARVPGGETTAFAVIRQVVVRRKRFKNLKMRTVPAVQRKLVRAIHMRILFWLGQPAHQLMPVKAKHTATGSAPFKRSGKRPQHQYAQSNQRRLYSVVQKKVQDIIPLREGSQVPAEKSKETVFVRFYPTQWCSAIKRLPTTET